MRKIHWLASYPKSGNTWLRAIVDRLLGPERPFDLDALGDSAPAFAGLTERYLAEHGVQVPADAPGEVRRHWPAVQQALCSAPGGDVFVKTHNVAAKFDSGPFPDPGLTRSVVYIVRDPRDVAISFAYHYRQPLGLAVAALCTSSAFHHKPQELGRTELLMSWGEHVAGWTALRRCPLLVLRYEDLLADPAAGIRRLAGFLGQQPAADQIETVVAATAFEQLRRQETEHGFKEAVRERGFFRAGKPRQWRALPDQAVFQPLLERFARTMHRYGYLEEVER